MEQIQRNPIDVHINIEQSIGLTRHRLEHILDNISSLRAGVIGDVCLDAYWEADMMRSTLSRETPHYTLPIAEERYSPGAGGNVAANLRALGCEKVYVCSAIGQDWRATLLQEQFTLSGIDMTYLIHADHWITPAYCKPIRVGLQQVKQEDARINFHNFQKLSETVTEQMVKAIDKMAEACDIIAVIDQFPYGVIGEQISEKLASWGRRGKVILVDSRERIGKFRNVIVKPNEIEASRWLNLQESHDSKINDWALMAKRLSQEVNGACCMTIGVEGAIWVERDRCTWVPTRPVAPPIDIVGAGDCFASALLCALGVGSDGVEATAFAHQAASIVIRKMGTTGTASQQELRDNAGLDV
jgi:rfaE bifunctional protein kinase chain/domain